MRIIEIRDKDNFLYERIVKTHELYFNSEMIETFKRFIKNKDPEKSLENLLADLKPFLSKEKKMKTTKYGDTFLLNDNIYEFAGNFIDAIVNIRENNYLEIYKVNSFSFTLKGKYGVEPVFVKVYFDNYLYTIQDATYVPLSVYEYNKKEPNDDRNYIINELSKIVEISKYKTKYFKETSLDLEPGSSEIILVKRKINFVIDDVSKLEYKGSYGNISNHPEFFKKNDINRKYAKKMLNDLDYSYYLKHFSFNKKEITKMLDNWQNKKTKTGVRINPYFASYFLDIVNFQNIDVDILQKMMSMFTRKDDRQDFEDLIRKSKLAKEKIDANKELKLIMMLQ